MKRNTCGHPDRTHYAHGQCVHCYKRANWAQRYRAQPDGYVFINAVREVLGQAPLGRVDARTNGYL